MKKNIFTLSTIGICLLSIMITGCNSCTKAEEKAWAKFLQQAKECSDRYDAFIADCNSKEAQARAELQTCRGDCNLINTGGCGLDVNCWVREYNACTDACLEKYYQKLRAIEECKQKWNVVFWDCMNAKQK